MTTPLPLDGMLVLDFSQFFAGPMAAMRLGDLGARVIKIERPQGGEIGVGSLSRESSKSATPCRFTVRTATKRAIPWT